MRSITVATCSLNQHALDFTGNLERIRKSFQIAKEKGATLRIGPELEISGYGCNDHFLENDTIVHSFQVLAELLQAQECQNILGDVGMPVLHNGVRYNCRIYFYNKRILLIRPKKFLANDGNYREMRWFSPWMLPFQVQDFSLTPEITAITGQRTVVFGDGILRCNDVTIGTELCEELFTPSSPHIALSLAGVEIISNGSASHHQFQKLSTKIELIRNSTLKCGGLYLYANQQGCDGERVYYDGCCMIILNGEIIGQGSQFGLDDVEVVSATVDLDTVATYRAAIVSRNFQAASATSSFPSIIVDEKLCSNIRRSLVSSPKKPTLLGPSEEIRYGPACWLWDYLRRSKQGGFFLPLSGGIDSCSTALIVYSMCELVHEKVLQGGIHVCNVIEFVDQYVLDDIRAITKNPDLTPSSPAEICNALFYTAYMGTTNSSPETRARAKKLADKLGSYHFDMDIDAIVAAFLLVFHKVTGKTPHYKVHGGTQGENLALQNVQARSRMVLSYLFAQLVLWSRGGSGSLLVLGSSNVDETLRGYFTKYDCSSADLNPIGGISKVDLRNFIHSWIDKDVGFQFLNEFLEALPTAELEPRSETYIQIDEVDMGMTYSDLSIFGTLRKILHLGPFSMFQSLLLGEWRLSFSPREIAEKVKRFFFYYGINRHKTTILPPSYHMSAYSPDDNRFDLRPFLYPNWSWQFGKIDEEISK